MALQRPINKRSHSRRSSDILSPFILIGAIRNVCRVLNDSFNQNWNSLFPSRGCCHTSERLAIQREIRIASFSLLQSVGSSFMGYKIPW